MQRLILTSSTAYDNIIKGLRESGEISACRGKRADKQDKDPFDLLHFWFSSQTASKSFKMLKENYLYSLLLYLQMEDKSPETSETPLNIINYSHHLFLLLLFLFPFDRCLQLQPKKAAGSLRFLAEPG